MMLEMDISECSFFNLLIFLNVLAYPGMITEFLNEFINEPKKPKKHGLKKFTLISLELNWHVLTPTAFYSVSNLKTSMKILRKLKIFGTSPPYQKTTNTTMPRLRISWGCLNWRLVLIRYLLVLVWFFLYTKSKIIKVKN